MSSDAELVVRPCSHEAAKYAVLNWHYSKTMPSGKLVKYGVWEGDRFWGAILFGRGPGPQIGRPFDLQQTEICELVRVAFDDGHDWQTSQPVSEALRRLHRDNPGLKLVISFADPLQDHRGVIYQAMNWIYVGTGVPSKNIFEIFGERLHSRTVAARYGTASVPWLRKNVDPNVRRLDDPLKHKYVMPMDKRTRRRMQKLALPYP